MKTAISIPDSIFRRAEEVAAAYGLSRSELYVTALREYLDECDSGSERITERLDEVYGEESAQLEPIIARAQSVAIGREEW